MVEAGVGVALLTVGLLIVAIVVIKSKSLFKPKTGQNKKTTCRPTMESAQQKDKDSIMIITPNRIHVIKN